MTCLCLAQGQRPNPSQEGTGVYDGQSTALAVQLALPVAHVFPLDISHLAGVHFAHRMLEDARQRRWDFRRCGIVSKVVHVARLCSA